MPLADKPPKKDGRRERTKVTRRSILNACRELFLDGKLEPTAVEIASRVGITTRTLFRHFSDVESLHRALVDKALAEAQAVMDEPFPEEIDGSDKWQDKLAHSINRRVRVYESLLPVFISPVFYRYRVQWAPTQLNVALRRRRLDTFLPAHILSDKNLFEAIDATLSIDFWMSLRHDQQLNVTRAHRVVERAIEKLIA